MKDLIVFSKKESCCPVAYTLKVIEGKWKMPILWVLSQNGTLRFSELKKSVDGITNLMLTNSLKELVNDGIVNRVQFNEIPPHVEYSLSEKGNKLEKAFNELAIWGAEVMNVDTTS